LEEGGEDWVGPVLLELGCDQPDLEEWVAKVLAEEGDLPVDLEEWMLDQFLEGQDLVPFTIHERLHPGGFCHQKGISHHLLGLDWLKSLSVGTDGQESNSDLFEKKVEI